MLVLTRHVGRSVTIGDEVTVTVLSTSGNRVCFGFTAPAKVAVHREEIYRRIRTSKLPPSASAAVGPTCAQPSDVTD
jgi:carbon storage regulator